MTLDGRITRFPFCQTREIDQGVHEGERRHTDDLPISGATDALRGREAIEDHGLERERLAAQPERHRNDL